LRNRISGLAGGPVIGLQTVEEMASFRGEEKDELKSETEEVDDDGSDEEDGDQK
jgi:hypothetical protein